MSLQTTYLAKKEATFERDTPGYRVQTCPFFSVFFAFLILLFVQFVLDMEVLVDGFFHTFYLTLDCEFYG